MSEEAADRASRSRLRAAVWAAFAVAALFLLNIDDLVLWAGLVVAAGLALAAVPALRPSPPKGRVDIRDLAAIGVLYVAVVAAFRLAFIVFTTDSVLGLFLSFAVGMILGVVGPVVYQVWVRGRDLRSIGLGAHRLRSTLTLGVVFAVVQFSTTLWGYDLPAPVDWVPLLVMSLVVGLFEAVFFKGSSRIVSRRVSVWCRRSAGLQPSMRYITPAMAWAARRCGSCSASAWSTR